MTFKPIFTALALTLVAMTAMPMTGHAMDKTMKHDDKMMMAMDEKMDKKMEQNQMAYSPALFQKMVDAKSNFVLAFHKKGCSACAEQQDSLNAIYKDSAYKNLSVLLVDFDNDTTALQTFKVGQQTTLISFKNGVEMERTTATSTNDIKTFLAK